MGDVVEPINGLPVQHEWPLRRYSGVSRTGGITRFPTVFLLVPRFATFAPTRTGLGVFLERQNICATAGIRYFLFVVTCADGSPLRWRPGGALYRHERCILWDWRALSIVVT